MVTLQRAAVLCGLLLLLVAQPALATPQKSVGPSAGDASTASATATGERARAKARARARTRAALRRELKRHPKAVFTSSFLRRASTVNFKLPLTVRLRPGAALGVTFLGLRRPLDTGTYPLPSGAQTIPLAGQFAMEMEFGASAGGFGSMPSRSGQYVSFSSTGGLRFAEYGDCTDPPPDPRPAFVETTPGSDITMSSSALTWTLLNPFSSLADGDLYLEVRPRSRVRRAASTCGAPGDFADFDLPPAPEGTEPWAQPIRLAWSGAFRIAPSITSTGNIRLGKLGVRDASSIPQPTTTGNIWACAPSSVLMGSTVPPGNACTEVSAPLVPPMEAVGAAPFPAQIKVVNLDADVLIGDVPPAP